MKALKHINLLGMKVVDKATNFKGVVTTIGFDLYGCIQAIVQPEVNSEGVLPQPAWFDINRLSTTGERVMETPNYDHQIIADGEQGCSEKPLR